VSKPQQSKRERGKRKNALYPEPTPKQQVARDAPRCSARMPSGFGLWTYCVLGLGHKGRHIYGGD
jgi:hypothetical protein